MVLVHCVFDKCGNQRKKNGKISFFSFPKEPDLLQKWINFINTHNPTKLSEQALDRERMKICHMHFEKNQVATKSNSDRVLVRNSVPRCPPGIVDKAHALKTSKPNKKSKKTKESKSSNSQAGKPAATANAQSKTNSPIVEGPPLYHTINGYVVDLRIAALQETFRLPNGKLIQVRRQPKKGSETEQEASTKLPTQQPSQPKSPVVSNASPIVQPPRSKPVQSKEPIVNGLPDSSTSVPRPAPGTPNLPTPPTSAHNTKASKTYINRRSGNPPVRTTAPSFRIAETRGPVVYPPSLSSLQSLMHKVHANTPFGNQLKDFEDRMITIAEISLHVVCKLNNLLNSNPYKNAAESRDIKYLYHTIGYLLEYAVGRFNDMEQTCVTDIINMGFTSKCDLGPLQNKQAEQPSADNPPTEKTPSEQQPTPTEEQPTSSNDNPPTSTEKDKTATNSDEEQPLPTKKANEEKTSEQPQSEVSEADEPDDEDDDCAIIEPRTDIIEVYSDDESDEPDGDDGKSGAQTAEPASISINPRQLRICSDTESVDRGDESTSDSDKSSEKTAPPKKQSNDGKDKQSNTKERPQSGSKEVQATVEETTEIEVVMNEVEETTIVHDYYYEAYTDDDDDDGEVVQVQQDVVETMEVDDDDDENDSSSRERQDGEEEETEELIEIIEGDVDLDLEEGQEYKVIEVVEGDFDNW